MTQVTSVSQPTAVFFVEARVVISEGQIAAAGEPGEIQYRSPQLRRVIGTSLKPPLRPSQMGGRRPHLAWSRP